MALARRGSKGFTHTHTHKMCARQELSIVLFLIIILLILISTSTIIATTASSLKEPMRRVASRFDFIVELMHRLHARDAALGPVPPQSLQPRLAAPEPCGDEHIFEVPKKNEIYFL